MGPKGLVSLLLFLLLFLSLAVPAVSFPLLGQGQVEVETDFGFGGYFFPDHPTPLRVWVKSYGPAFEGRIVVSQEIRSPWGGVVEERLILPFRSAGPGRRLFRLNFPVRGYIYPLTITVFVEGEPLYHREIKLKERALGERPVLALGAPFPLELPTGERPIRLDPEALPEEWPGLLAVRRIYLGRLNPARLTEAQWEALLRWLARGGELVVLGGENWYLQDSPRIRRLIPFLPRGMGGWEGKEIVLGEPRGEILYQSQEGLPILVARKHGRGRVIFSALDPLTLTPALGDEGTELEFEFEFEIREAIWKVLGMDGDGGGADSVMARAGLAADLLAQLPLPSPSKLILIGIYVLYLGGLALLGRLAVRRPRAVLLVLGLILLWLAGVMVLIARYLGRPGLAERLLGLELGLIHDFGEAALHSSWLALFARAETDLTLRVEPGDGYLWQALPPALERGDHLYDVDYLLGEGGMEASFKVERWRTRAFYLERFSGDLVEFRIEDGRVVAKNLSPYSFYDCRLLSSSSGKLYALGPGELRPWERLEAEPGPEAPRPREPLWAGLYRLVLEELHDTDALFCVWGGESESDGWGGFSRSPQEERKVLRVALIEGENEDEDEEEG